MGTGGLLLHDRLAGVIGQAMWRQDGRSLMACDVSASFLVSVLVGKRPTSLNVVQNWTAQLGKAP